MRDMNQDTEKRSLRDTHVEDNSILETVSQRTTDGG